MLDREGFRPNVGIILLNAQNEVWWGKRVREHSWQFPQGGIKYGETPEQAMYRELEEEIGLTAADVEVLACTRGWLRYRLPRQFIRHDQRPLCIGQKQRWYLLRSREPTPAIRFDTTGEPGAKPYLPDHILWRQKEQFSDGVGYGWIDGVAKGAAR